MLRRSPASQLNRLLLPTFGRPTMATRGIEVCGRSAGAGASAGAGGGVCGGGHRSGLA